MYEKKIPFDIDCGIKIAMEVIGGKWKSCIILELDNGPKRPGNGIGRSLSCRFFCFRPARKKHRRGSVRS